MPDSFLFTIACTEAPQFDVLLGNVASGVLERAGFGPAAVAEIIGTLRAALEKHAVEGFRECDTVFRTEAGRLVIVVTYADGREWRLTRPLPPAD